MTRKEAIEALQRTVAFSEEADFVEAKRMAIEALSAEAEMDGDMGEVSDCYHTFNQLYHQRAVLFATIVKQNKEKAWKSWKHSDGKFCFDSNKEWFIVGVDTPEGSYTYHYKKKYWDMFDCVELEHGKFWDGHTEEDVTRLLSLPSADAVEVKAEQLPPKVPSEWINEGMVLVPKHDWIELQKKLEEYVSAKAVEVVCCKDCKHWHEWENATGSCLRSENGCNWFGTDAIDYCSFGERKNDSE